MIQSSENIKSAVRETNISEMADRGTAFGPAASQVVKTTYVKEINLKKELIEKARHGFLGTRLADVETSSYLAAQESTARALNGTLFFTQANSDRGVFGYTTQLGNVDGESLNESLPVESAIRDGATKAVAEFKAKKNAKAISEFNALQELAVKESNPAVKSLIKQAADLKLESYRVAASTN